MSEEEAPDDGAARGASLARSAMPGSAATAPLFLVVGPPAVGKTTTSRALAGRLERSVHIPVDDLRHMVVSGLALPALPWTDEIVHQVALARGVAIRMAEAYAAAGFAVVLDDFPDPHLLAEYAALGARPRVHRILLMPPQAVALGRLRARSGHGPEADYIKEVLPVAYAIVRPHVDRLAAEGWVVLDTTALGVEETVDEILARTGEPPGA